MKLQMLDITCPRCRHKPELKTRKLGDIELHYFKCECTESAGWEKIGYALSSWIIAVGENGAFDWILKLKIEND